jgi:hypothetical protein
VEDDERHLAVAVVLDEHGRLLVDRATRSALATEFEDSWPQDAAAAILFERLGANVPRSRMAATHVDLGAELYAHFLWMKLRSDEVGAAPESVHWVAAEEIADEPGLLADGPVRAEVLRLAFGWTDAAARYTPAIPPKVDPTAVDWADPHVRTAALDAMGHSELDLASGMVGEWEVTVGGGDHDLYMLTADGPDGVLNALTRTDGDAEIDIRVGGQMISLPEAYGLSRAEVDAALDDLCSGDLTGPRWELDEG